MSLRLSRRHRYAIDSVLALLLLSGLAWLGLDRGDALDVALGTWLRADTRVHAAAGLAIVFLVGTLWLVHLQPWWRSQRNRLPGALALAGLALMAVSGYALGYLVDEAGHAWMGRLHWIAGVAGAVCYVWHRVQGPRTRPG